MERECKIIGGLKVEENNVLNKLADEELKFYCILSKQTEDGIIGFKLRLLI